MNQANGCYANSFFFACFLYADDIMLLSVWTETIHYTAWYIDASVGTLQNRWLM